MGYPVPDAHVIHRWVGTSLFFGDPELQIPQPFEVMSAASCLHLQSAYVWSLPPTSAWEGLFTGFPEIHSHQTSRAWLMSQKMGRGATGRLGLCPPHPAASLCFLSFLLAPRPPGCSQFFPLCRREQVRFSQLVHREAL